MPTPPDPPADKATTAGARPSGTASGAKPGTAADADDDPPTLIIRSGPSAAESTPPGTRATGQASVPQPTPEDSPIVQLQRAVRRQQALAGRKPNEDLVWQPRFAYGSAVIILVALTVISLPLWIVLYRITGFSGGPPPAVADLVALCMMLLGGFLTAAALWVIIIEMRGRARMVDTLAKTGERELMVAPVAPEIPVLDAPQDHLVVAERIHTGAPDWEATPIPPRIAARVEAQQASAAATLEASGKLLSSFGGVLKSFGQLPAQVAMLIVALALFVGATVLSLK